MRIKIISGSLKGRLIQTPTGHNTHPMSEKIRGALFNMLGDISGLTFLDAYAGSGAIALEALSRGAVNVVAIDNDKNAFRCIDENIKSLAAQIKVTRANISSWIENNQDKQFDIVVADPPYDHINSEHLKKLENCVTVGGIYVVSCPSTFTPDLSAEFDLQARKEYGDASLVFYKKIG